MAKRARETDTTCEHSKSFWITDSVNYQDLRPQWQLFKHANTVSLVNAENT